MFGRAEGNKVICILFNKYYNVEIYVFMMLFVKFVIMCAAFLTECLTFMESECSRYYTADQFGSHRLYLRSYVSCNNLKFNSNQSKINAFTITI